MKKLIVLFGPEDSGKTTTLKKVYELLKPFNMSETRRFKYYDSDYSVSDFQDVLIFDSPKTISDSVTSTHPSSSYTINNTEDYNAVLTRLKKIFSSYEQIDSIEKLDELLKKCDSVEKFDNVIKELENDTNKKTDEKINDVVQKDEYRVGFSLEGDYGFKHYQTEYWAKHSRNLYENLIELNDCNTIICACSKYPAGTIDQQPLLCILFFIIYCYLTSIPLQIHLVESIPLPKTQWDTKNRENAKIANKIINLI